MGVLDVDMSLLQWGYRVSKHVTYVLVELHRHIIVLGDYLLGWTGLLYVLCAEVLYKKLLLNCAFSP